MQIFSYKKYFFYLGELLQPLLVSNGSTKGRLASILLQKCVNHSALHDIHFQVLARKHGHKNWHFVLRGGRGGKQIEARNSAKEQTLFREEHEDPRYNDGTGNDVDQFFQCKQIQDLINIY
jgi:hypothetical protein